MFIGEIINIFESLAFSKVLEAKITKDGFDLVVDKGNYNHSIQEFVESINKEKYYESSLVDFPIEDWFVEVHPEKGLVYHFYDCFYYKTDAEELRRIGLQQKAVETPVEVTTEVCQSTENECETGEARTTVILNKELVKKVKYIALAEGSGIKDKVTEGLTAIVEQWEAVNGEINIK